MNKQDMATIALADKVELLLGADDFNGLLSNKLTSKMPKFTEVNKSGRQKWYEDGDAVFRCSLHITTDIVTELITKHTKVNKILPTFAWTLRITGKDQVSYNLDFNGELAELEFDTPEQGFPKANLGIEISDQILDVNPA